MGFGIVRGKKIKLDGLKGIEIHVERKKTSRSNPDIDKTRTIKNYSLLPELRKISLNQKVDSRIKELPGQKTKSGKIRKIQSNAVRLYDFFVGFSHEDSARLTPAQQKNYFSDALKFFQKHFGKENVMYAEVHNDERTPHLHLGLIPEYHGKLSAYLLFTPESCIKLQDDFYKEVSSKYGLERGEVGSEEKHLSPVELKSKTLSEIKELEKKRDALKTEVELKGNELKTIAALKKVAKERPIKDGILGRGKIIGYEVAPSFISESMRLAKIGAGAADEIARKDGEIAELKLTNRKLEITLQDEREEKERAEIERARIFADSLPFFEASDELRAAFLRRLEEEKKKKIRKKDQVREHPKDLGR